MSEILDGILNACFPTKTLTIRDCDDPWITKEIRRLIRKRKRIFKKYGRCSKWHKLKKLIGMKIQEAKKIYLEKGKEQAKLKNDSSGYYKVVNNLRDGEAPKVFDVRSLRPDMTEKEIADDIALFFNGITSGYVPLPERNSIPKLPHQTIEKFEIASRIKTFKKPRSMIKGDLFPDLVTKYADILAIPMSDIINTSIASKTWPATWKEETMIIIPKTNNPTTYGELRNLSCTPLFSKILESFVLDKLKKEIKVDPSQYGSTKNCGTEHYLIQTWNHILESIDDEKTACNLISIDFSKAFNSLDHAKCLDMFQKRGASEESIQMLYAFLECRKMSVRIGTSMSDPLPINGGSPQGTLLGNLIFIVATSELDKDIEYSEINHDSIPSDNRLLQPEDQPVHFNEEEFSTDRESPESTTSSIRFFRDSNIRTFPDSSSDSSETERSMIEYEEIRATLIPENWSPGRPQIVKYVDDILGSEKICFTAGKLHSTTSKQTSTVNALRSEELIASITMSAAEIGLGVNAKKTQMICVSSSAAIDVTTFIRDPSDQSLKTFSGGELKILGFYFDKRPTVDRHIEHLQKKFKKRLAITELETS